MPRKTDRYLPLALLCVSANVRNTSNTEARDTRLGLQAVSTPPAASHRVDHDCRPAEGPRRTRATVHDEPDRLCRCPTIPSKSQSSSARWSWHPNRSTTTPSANRSDSTTSTPASVPAAEYAPSGFARGVRRQLVARTRRSGKTDSGAAQSPRVRITDIQTVSGLRRTAQPPGGCHTAWCEACNVGGNRDHVARVNLARRGLAGRRRAVGIRGGRTEIRTSRTPPVRKCRCGTRWNPQHRVVVWVAVRDVDLHRLPRRWQEVPDLRRR